MMRERVGTRAPVTAVALLAAFAVLLRVGYLWFITATPGFVWINPDGYAEAGRLLAGDTEGWRLDHEAFRYSGPFVKAPLYPIFLSLFARFSSEYEWAAALVEAVIGGLAVIGIWSIGRDLHSDRAGLIAAAIAAVYFPTIVMLNAIMQERLYVPLLILAFALLVRAVTTARASLFAAAGAALGLAALTRSLPLYFVGPAMLVVLARAPSARRGMRDGAWVLGAFAALVAPYCVWASRAFGQLVLIENIGTFGLAKSELGRAWFASDRAPGLMETVRFVWASANGAPQTLLADHVRLVLSMFQMGGGRWLEVHGSLPDAGAAMVAKVAAHATGDLPLLLAAALGPLGFALARRGTAAGLLALWVGVHLTMVAVAGYAGQRFREPIEWTLIIGAGVVMAGQWRRPGAIVVAACTILGLAAGWAAVQTAPASLAARADYGIGVWQDGELGRFTRGFRHAGFNVFPVRGVIEVLVEPRGPAGRSPAVTVDGVPVPEWSGTPDPDGYRFRVTSQQNRAFATVAFEPQTGQPMVITVLDHSAGRAR